MFSKLINKLFKETTNIADISPVTFNTSGTFNPRYGKQHLTVTGKGSDGASYPTPTAAGYNGYTGTDTGYTGTATGYNGTANATGYTGTATGYTGTANATGYTGTATGYTGTATGYNGTAYNTGSHPVDNANSVPDEVWVNWGSYTVVHYLNNEIVSQSYYTGMNPNLPSPSYSDGPYPINGVYFRWTSVDYNTLGYYTFPGTTNYQSTYGGNNQYGTGSYTYGTGSYTYGTGSYNYTYGTGSYTYGTGSYTYSYGTGPYSYGTGSYSYGTGPYTYSYGTGSYSYGTGPYSYGTGNNSYPAANYPTPVLGVSMNAFNITFPAGTYSTSPTLTNQPVSTIPYNTSVSLTVPTGGYITINFKI